MAEGDRHLDALTLKSSVSFTYRREVDLSDLSDVFTKEFTDSLTDGTGTDQSDRVFRDQRSVSSGSPDDIDLAGTAIQDVFGQDLTFVDISLLHITHTGASNNLIIGGIGATGWIGPLAANSDTFTLGPGGHALWFSPADGQWVVTAGTADILRVAASAGTIVYDIILVGRSA